MGHAVNDIVEVSYRGQCEGQLILNIWHYQVSGSTSQSSDIADNTTLAQFLRAQTQEFQITKEYLDLHPINYTLDFVRAQKIWPTRSRYGQSFSGLAGFWPTVSNNTNTAATITKQGTGGNRWSTGSIHIGPIAQDGHDRGNLTDPIMAAMDSFAQAYRLTFTTPANNITYRPVIYNPGRTPNFELVLALLYQPEVRTMRRRTLGLGK